MSGKNWLNKDSFWRVLSELEKLETVTPLEEFCSFLKVSDKQLMQIIQFLNELNIETAVQLDEGKAFVHPLRPSQVISFEFGLTEWLAIQASFPILSESLQARPYYPILVRKLEQLEDKFKHYALFSSDMDGVKDEKILSLKTPYSVEEEILKTIEQAIETQSLLLVKLHGEGRIDLFPHKLVHIEGHLNIVGEDKLDHCLSTVSLDQIQKLDCSPFETYRPNYTSAEVNDFIARLREMNGNEVRLVLKVSREQPDLKLCPTHHFLGDPYVTKNTLGDFIWAASVENCSDIIDWLVGLGDQVEILDPIDFKEKVERLINEQKKSA